MSTDAVPTPATVHPPYQGGEAVGFVHPRLPGVRLVPRADGIELRGEPQQVLSPSAARVLASALFAMAELLEPKREARGTGWRPA